MQQPVVAEDINATVTIIPDPDTDISDPGDSATGFNLDQSCDGSTDFRFGAGNLEFEATVYDWMIISGATALYKGEGTVDGSPGLYKFMVTANDANISGYGITEDGFRIKIWQQDSNGVETVLYDNGLGVDSKGGTTALGGGSIKIYTVKKKK